jgi:Domain of Unknown Function with PDB structure (DUF3857)/Transglutaminase-like superfamily
MRRYFAAFLCCIGFLSFHANSFAGPDWQQPTPEELSMTSDPAAPGAAAIILYRDETTDDNLKYYEVYVREKILTEAAKKDGDVEVGYEHRFLTFNSVSGRTIHSDGTIIPFTGKPYDKVIEKTRDMKYQTRVFSLPDVQVGSIIEYRYSMRYDDRFSRTASWFLQGEYFTRKEHFRYIPINMDRYTILDNKGRASSGIAYVQILPPGVMPHFVEVPGGNATNGFKNFFEMETSNIKAIVKENYQPPIQGMSYRVLFYNVFYDSPDKFWKGAGKNWSKEVDRFIGPNNGVSQAVSQLVAAGDTPDQKLHKIYTAVMALENTDFTREHSVEEDKANGVNPTKTTDDVWARKRGNSDEIAMLFIGMARAAGMPAYLMRVTNRERSIFQINLQSLDQLDDNIAIVQVNGKDQFFDPGSRYCTYGQLNWRHTDAGGLRQASGGTEIAESPHMNYKESLEEWAARLQMDETGKAKGIVQVRYTGAPALTWRQTILKGDLNEETKEMEDLVRSRLPGGMNVKMKRLGAPADPAQPLIAVFDVSGPIATGTSKRVFIPGQLFQTNSKPTFVSPVRINPVYFDYPYFELDDVQITPPAGMSVESTPKTENEAMQQSAFYAVTSGMKGNAISIVRQFAVGSFLFPVKDYPELKAFYDKVSVGDQQQIVLKTNASANGN